MKDIFIVTRVDCNYCPVCEIFNTEDEAVEFVKKDFENCGFSWDGRYSMVSGFEDDRCFPICECEDGSHEWDIRKKTITDNRMNKGWKLQNLSAIVMWERQKSSINIFSSFATERIAVNVQCMMLLIANLHGRRCRMSQKLR